MHLNSQLYAKEDSKIDLKLSSNNRDSPKMATGDSTMSDLPGILRYHDNFFIPQHCSDQVILAGTLTGVQGDIRCKVLAALSTDFPQ